MSGYSYRAFCEAVGRIHGDQCWLRHTLGRRLPIVSTRELRCDGLMDGHHLIPKQALRREFPHGVALGADGRYKRLDMPDDARGSRSLGSRSLGDLLNDGRNGVPVCRRHHDLIEHAVVQIRRDELPEAAEWFAALLGLGWLLDRMYGER